MAHDDAPKKFPKKKTGFRKGTSRHGTTYRPVRAGGTPKPGGKRTRLRKSTKGLHTIESKQGSRWRNLKQNQALRGQKYTGGFLKGKAVQSGLKGAGRTLGKFAGGLGALVAAVDIGRAVKEGVAAVRAQRDLTATKAGSERKYGTTGRAVATRHAKTIKGAKSNVEGKTTKKPRKGNFKTIGATAGGKYYEHKRFTLKPIKIKLVGRGK